MQFKHADLRNYYHFYAMLVACLSVFSTQMLQAETSLPVPLGTGADLQLYRPSLNHLGLLGIESAETLEPGGLSFGLGFSLLNSPLSLTYSDPLEASGTSTPVVGSLMLTHLQLSAGVLPWLELGAAMPVLNAADALHPVSGSPLSGVYPGDARVYARAALLPARSGLPAIGLLLPMSLPTGEPDAWVGEPGVTFAPAFLVGRSRERIGWSVNLGARIRQPTLLRFEPAGAELTLGSEAAASAAVELEATQGLRVGAGLEALLVQVEDSTSARVERRVEGRVGLRQSLPAGLIASLGGAFGLSSGFGVPVWEVFAGLSWRYGASGPEVRDTDRDGLADDLDRCTDQPEDIDIFEDDDGCPDLDNDKDGLPDPQDRCPLEAESVNQFYDDDGCPEPDRDSDAIPDLKDPCPDHPEDADGFLDSDGCPELDADQDSILDDADRCPLEPEDLDAFSDEDGCRDPDNDLDGVPDERDACPLEPVDGAFVEGQTGQGDGCPPAPPPPIDRIELRPEEDDLAPALAKAAHALDDFDQDGVPDVRDSCPRKQETPNGFQDDDGCPEADRDLDGILDRRDRCPRTPESKNGFRDLDGCPDTAPEGMASQGGTASLPSSGAALSAPDLEPAQVTPSPALAAGTVGGAETTAPSSSAAASPAGRAAEPGLSVTTAAAADRDGDGVPDTADRCPRLPEIWNGVRDDDGCPEKDRDGDGIVDILDRCPTLRELINGLEDSDGCPEPDRDRDGIPDLRDQCPKVPETANGFQDDDGCWDAVPPPGRR